MGSGLGEFSTEPVLAFTSWQGQLVAAGSFSGAVAIWSGTQWQPLGTLAGNVNALAVFEDQLYAGGWFGSAAGGPVGVARWTP
jgi:hypothetical protein